MSKLPDGYRAQDGCHNCKHVFVRYDHDEGQSFYCTMGAGVRPPCMSVAMDECPGLAYNTAIFDAAYDAWDEWSDGREVRPSSICPQYEPREGT